MGRLSSGVARCGRRWCGRLAQLLGWIPLADYVTPSLLDTVFRFASLNESSHVAVGTAAMSCVNEMLTRHGVPRNFDDFILQVYR